MKKNSKTIVVYGQRRSGTSLLSGILYHLGINMGDGAEPTQTSRTNPTGFFEDRSIIEVSERILRYMKTMTGRLQVAQLKEIFEILDNEFGDQIKKAIDNRGEDTWGFKDVNQVVLHPVYKKYLTNPHYIVIFRNPLAIAQSMQHWHTKNTLTRMCAAVKDETARMMNFIINETDPMLLLTYEESFRDKEEFIEKIITFLKIKPTDEQRKKAMSLINIKYCHF